MDGLSGPNSAGNSIAGPGNSITSQPQPGPLSQPNMRPGMGMAQSMGAPNNMTLVNALAGPGKAPGPMSNVRAPAPNNSISDTHTSMGGTGPMNQQGKGIFSNIFYLKCSQNYKYTLL